MLCEPYENARKDFACVLKMGLYNADIERKKKGKEKKMQIEILYISDCCGSYLSDEHVAYEICPDCKEHCEVIREEYNVTPN